MNNNIHVWRARREITQQELADAVGVSRQTINAIEGERYDPSLELAYELAHYFDCDIDDIFTYEPDTNTDQ